MSSAFFLPVAPGSRFCIYHSAVHDSVGRGIVYVHPFCEEMNKARRMASLQSRRMATAGYSVLQIDLFGTGDSSGDFVDARWEIWKRDLQMAIEWLKSRVAGPVSLWGLRLGATLAVDVARDPSLNIEQLILWQPITSGERFLSQFLRLRLASEMLTEGTSRNGVRELRDALRHGVSLEVAGYDLHKQLATEIEILQLADLTPVAMHVNWLETSAQAGQKLSPASQQVLDAWRTNGLDVRAETVAGEPFWSTIEITECEALLAATEGTLAGKSQTTDKV